MPLSYEQLTSEEGLKRLALMCKRRIEESRNSNIEKAKKMKFYKTGQLMALAPTANERQGRFRFVPPIFQTAVYTWVAGVRGAFHKDPLLTIVPKGQTTAEAKIGTQAIVDWNVEETRHLLAFMRAIWDGFQAGLGVLKRVFEIRVLPRPITIQGATGEVVTQIAQEMNGNDYTYRVNPLNYLQDTTALGNHFLMDKCKWCGEVTLSSVISIAGMKDLEGAISKNIRFVVSKAKEKARADRQNWEPDTNTDVDLDYSNKTVNYELYGLWPIKGNELDTRYFMVVYNETYDRVILVKPVIDHPYTLIRPLSKNNSYLGISPCESVVSINMLASVMTNKGIENILQNLKRFVFYLKDSGITKRDLQEVPNNGFIGVDARAAGVQQISQIVQEFQGRDINVGSMQAYLAMFNDWVQKSTSQSDLLTFGVKPSVGGGLNHAGYTATGANIVDQNMKTNAAHVINNIAEQHEEHWDKKLLALQELLPDYQILEIAGVDPILVRKAVTVGNYKADIVSGIVTNKASQLQNLVNIFQFLAQIMPAATNAGQQINMDFTALMREASRLGDLPNRQNIFPEATAAPVIEGGPAPELGGAAQGGGLPV